MSQHDTELIGKVLFSRCLEEGFWPDKIQFTKLLYLIDYCYFRYKAEQATDIPWLFYHYGPWSPAINPLAEAVQNEFRLGWKDLNTVEEDREFYGYDPIKEKLGLTLESIIKTLITTFKNRDVTDLIDYCYSNTEPMRSAERGDTLSYENVPVDERMPLFYPKTKTKEMPKISSALMKRFEAKKQKLQQLKERNVKWQQAMDTTDFAEAINILNRERLSNVPDSQIQNVYLSDEAISDLENTGL